jgi:hypothetical protein
LIKVETKNHFKTAIKAKKVLTKMLKYLLGKNETELTCFNFVVEKGKKNYVGYVGLVGKNLESYVEMVAGLPINKQI